MKRVVLISLGLWCAASAAAEAQTRVVVHDFEGPGASQIRSVVVDILEQRAVEVVSTKVANAQARRSGAELDSESGRVRVAKKLRLNAFVEGRVERARRAFKVKITVYGARDGMVAGEMNLSAPKRQLASEVKATMWEQLGPAIRGEAAAVAEPDPEPEFVEAAPVQPQRPQRPARTTRPAPPPVEDEEVAEAPQPEEEIEEPETEETEEPSKPSTFAAASPLDINVGARFGGRSYKYNDPFPGLRKYGMTVSPNLRLHLRWFPVAHFDDSLLSNFGLDLRGEVLVGVSSKNRAGQKFETSAHSFGFGLRGRLPLRSLELGALLGYGVHAFSLEGTSKADPDVPDANYGFLRAGVDARVSFSIMYVQLAMAYLFGLSHGEIAEDAWFPHTTGDGVELDLAAGVFFSRTIGLELAFGLQRYFMTFDPQPRDPGVRGPGRVAGGAVDQYLSGRVAMVIRL